MSINLTMIGQAISFALFVWFCMKYVWPPLTEVMRERQRQIAAGLEKAAKAEQQLEEASSSAANELEDAKQQAAELITQARNRANQIVEDAKAEATEAAKRIEHEAEARIDQEVSRAREELRARVSDLAVEGAERILEETVDRDRHQRMLDEIASRL